MAFAALRLMRRFFVKWGAADPLVSRLCDPAGCHQVRRDRAVANIPWMMSRIDHPTCFASLPFCYLSEQAQPNRDKRNHTIFMTFSPTSAPVSALRRSNPLRSLRLISWARHPCAANSFTAVLTSSGRLPARSFCLSCELTLTTVL